MPVSAPKLFGVQNLLSQAQSDTLIFRDLKWIDRSPTMVVEPLIDGTPSGELERISITPNAFIGVDFSSAALASRGISDQRFCAGYAKASEEHTGFYTVACPPFRNHSSRQTVPPMLGTGRIFSDARDSPRRSLNLSG